MIDDNPLSLWYNQNKTNIDKITSISESLRPETGRGEGPRGEFSSRANRSICGVNSNPNQSIKFSQKWPQKSG